MKSGEDNDFGLIPSAIKSSVIESSWLVLVCGIMVSMQSSSNVFNKFSAFLIITRVSESGSVASAACSTSYGASVGSSVPRYPKI